MKKTKDQQNVRKISNLKFDSVKKTRNHRVWMTYNEDS